MDNEFTLPVLHQGVEMNFPVRLVSMGYTYKLMITVEDTTLVFERDEELNLRALIDPEMLAKHKQIDASLLEAISAALAALLT